MNDFTKEDVSILLEEVFHCIQHAMTDMCKCKESDVSYHSLEYTEKLIFEFWSTFYGDDSMIINEKQIMALMLHAQND